MTITKVGLAGTMESSDIMITLEPKDTEGLEISLDSTVEKQFGREIRRVIVQTLTELGITAAVVTAVDKGALDCAIRARVKTAAYRGAGAQPTAWEGGKTMSKKLRRTMLFVPGNNPGMLKDAAIYKADCIMFDLEDSVSVDEKDAARFLVHEALRFLDLTETEYLVRINALDCGGIMDLEAVVPAGNVAIRLPKTESAQDVRDCEKEIARIEKKHGMQVGTVRMMAAVESAKGALGAKEIALSTPRLIGMALGAEDYVTDLKTTRSPGGVELMFGRSMILLAARAAGIDAIDTVYSDVDNEDGFRTEVALIKQLGFDGKSVINPRQIGPVHEIFTPSLQEIEKALQVVEAIKEANRKGSGVISLNGKMIDKPIVMRAQRTIDLAVATGILEKESGHGG